MPKGLSNNREGVSSQSPRIIENKSIGEIGSVVESSTSKNSARIKVRPGPSGFHVRPTTRLIPILKRIEGKYSVGITIDMGNGSETIGEPTDMLMRELREGREFEFVVHGPNSALAMPEVIAAIDSLNTDPIGGNQSVKTGIEGLLGNNFFTKQ